MQTEYIQDSPTGKEKFKWLGPAFIWMLSAAGSGELLFTPRIAAQYGYSLFWAMTLAVLLKWFINREIGRYTVCTGLNVFQGFQRIKGPLNWVVWFILIPQVPIAVATLAGLIGASATALVLLIDLPLNILVAVTLLFSTLVILMGKYATLEKITTVFAVVSSLAVMIAAVSIGPDVKEMGKGFLLSIPENIKYDEVLPWIGFLLAGASGLMWFSFWIQTRGYGAASRNSEQLADEITYEQANIKKLQKWIRYMTVANTCAVVGALIIAIAFLILGAELLKPKGLVPEENKIAENLGNLLGEIWGRAGFWFMIGIVFVTFFSTLISNQDGFARMFMGGIKILFPNHVNKHRLLTEKRIEKYITILLLAVMPLGIYMYAGEPVGLLKLAGAVAAIQIPIVTGFVLYMNATTLPKQLKPSLVSLSGTLIAGLFFALFSVVYFMQIL